MITIIKYRHSCIAPKDTGVTSQLRPTKISLLKEFLQTTVMWINYLIYFFSALLPELACPRHHSGGIREPLAV